MTSAATITLLANMGLLGLPVERYVTNRDHRERLLWEAVANRAIAIVNKLNKGK